MHTGTGLTSGTLIAAIESPEAISALDPRRYPAIDADLSDFADPACNSCYLTGKNSCPFSRRACTFGVYAS